MNCDGVCIKCTGNYPKENLFRGKSIDTGNWFYGNYIWKPWLEDNGEKKRVLALSDGELVVHVDPVTVGEFTGALAGNRAMIFEGDVIDLPGWIVSYSTGMKCYYGMQAGWYIQRDNWESWEELQNTDRFVILGNIHDNPELADSRTMQII